MKANLTTPLERLLAPHVTDAVTATITRTTELIAEEMAREILRDPAFRAEMQSIIRSQFANTLRELKRRPTRRGRK